MVTAISLEKTLGLRGLIKRLGEAWRTPEITAFDADVTLLKKRHYKRTTKDIRSNRIVQRDILLILKTHGPTLWPVMDARESGPAKWLFEAGSIPEYPKDLVYPRDRKSIEPIFVSLLIEKCVHYKTNHDRDTPLPTKKLQQNSTKRVRRKLSRKTLEPDSDQTEFESDASYSRQSSPGGQNHSSDNDQEDIREDIITRSRFKPLPLLVKVKLPCMSLLALAAGSKIWPPAAMQHQTPDQNSHIVASASAKAKRHADSLQERPTKRRNATTVDRDHSALPPPAAPIRLITDAETRDFNVETIASGAKTGTTHVSYPGAPNHLRRGPLLPDINNHPYDARHVENAKAVEQPANSQATQRDIQARRPKEREEEAQTLAQRLAEAEQTQRAGQQAAKQAALDVARLRNQERLRRAREAGHGTENSVAKSEKGLDAEIVHAAPINRMLQTSLVVKDGEDMEHYDYLGEKTANEIRETLNQHAYRMPGGAFIPVQRFEFTIWQNGRQQNARNGAPNSDAFEAAWGTVNRRLQDLTGNMGDTFQIVAECRF